MPDARPLTDSDLPQAQRIVRVAFGTFLGAPDPENFWTDFDYVFGRHGAEHVASYGADVNGALAGVNFATLWGSVGFFGPLAVRPDLWDRGVAQPLVAAVSDQFERWGVRHAGLCTFPHSTKHVWLYQKFGFYPRYLTAIMAAPAGAAAPLPPSSRYSELALAERREAEKACRNLTEELYQGLDLGGEIRTVAARNLGDTLLLSEDFWPPRRFRHLPLGAGQRGRRRLPVRQVRRGESGPGSGRPFCGAPRRLRRARRLGRDEKRPGRGQSGARGSLPNDDSARLSQPDPGGDDASSERAGL